MGFVGGQFPFSTQLVSALSSTATFGANLLLTTYCSDVCCLGGTFRYYSKVKTLTNSIFCGMVIGVEDRLINHLLLELAVVVTLDWLDVAVVVVVIVEVVIWAISVVAVSSCHGDISN